MAYLIIVYWRDIPAQIIAERGKGRKKEKAKVEFAKEEINNNIKVAKKIEEIK